MIAAYVSGLNACDYCYGSHQAIAADLNVEPKLLEAILKDIVTAPIEDPLRPVFTLVHKLTLNPSKTTQADIDAVFAAGWDEQAIEDAIATATTEGLTQCQRKPIAVCSLFNFMNRFVDGYGLEQPNKEQLAAMAKGINAQGYQAALQEVSRRSHIGSRYCHLSNIKIYRTCSY